MKCAICMMVKLGEPFDAYTIRSGTAVCVHHMTHVPDNNIDRAYRQLFVEGGKIHYHTDADYVDEDEDE